jgi:Winged helix DNA-binding domain
VAAPRAKRVDPERLPRVRAAAQLLDRPSSIRDPVEVVRLAAGVQAQDPYAARLGIRARARGLSAAEVDRAREEGSLLRGWVMRGTLHLYPADDAAWLATLFASRELAWSRKRVAEGLGLDARGQERAVKLMARVLEGRGPVARTEVAEQLAEHGIPTDGSIASFHVPRLAVLSGIACMGPEQAGRTTYVLGREWIGEPPPVDYERALEELARRHLGAFGPADERDLAAWSGLGLRVCRAAIARIAAELEEVWVGEERRWMLRKRPARTPRRPLVRLLPAFDNHLMGHGSREAAVPAGELTRVWPGGGIVRATVLVDGVAVATWRARRAGGKLRIAVAPFGPLPGRVEEAVAREVAEIGRFERMTPVLER